MSDNINMLQARLARGEISVAQYNELYALIAVAVSPTTRARGTLQVEVVNEAHGSVALYENAIAIGAALVFIDTIRVMSVFLYKGSLNTATISQVSGFDLTTADEREYKVKEDGVLKKGANDRHGAVRSIAATLQKKTYSARIEHALNQLRSIGHVKIGQIRMGTTPVMLRANGTIVCGGFSGSLRNCGTLDFGTRHKGFFGEYNSHSPNDVTFAERDITKGFDLSDKLIGKPFGSLMFTMSGLGSDVTHAMLDWLRNPRNVV